jgi:hypothetical protein
MKSTLSAVRTVWSVINSRKSELGISGNVIWLLRPKNSVKEDIVVNALAMDGDELQEGLINVRIHIPNAPLSNDDTQPNFIRFEQVLDKLLPILQDVWGYDYNFRVDEPGTPERDGINWFLTIRVQYYTIRN